MIHIPAKCGDCQRPFDGGKREVTLAGEMWEFRPGQTPRWVGMVPKHIRRLMFLMSGKFTTKEFP